MFTYDHRIHEIQKFHGKQNESASCGLLKMIRGKLLSLRFWKNSQMTIFFFKQGLRSCMNAMRRVLYLKRKSVIFCNFWSSCSVYSLYIWMKNANEPEFSSTTTSFNFWSMSDFTHTKETVNSPGFWQWFLIQSERQCEVVWVVRHLGYEMRRWRGRWSGTAHSQCLTSPQQRVRNSCPCYLATWTNNDG